ncbi:hypothetical protein KS4_04680 [Poriferisphaera corsica]|uniref:Uncharacterized protein n=1 Tax=Poriferisphaera corsica TaxID=2528020 RepID=A0A517YQD7_9BACT|nr:hypothetical protein KS4_04680 [Poriferisphaera corsica]
MIHRDFRLYLYMETNWKSVHIKNKQMRVIGYIPFFCEIDRRQYTNVVIRNRVRYK